MTYIEYATIPAHRQMNDGDKGSMLKPGDAVLWSGKPAVPAMGQRVEVDFNNLGAGEVIGYFTEGGYLGLRLKPDARPDWHVKQNKGDVYHVFGAEITIL